MRGTKANPATPVSPRRRDYLWEGPRETADPSKAEHKPYTILKDPSAYIIGGILLYTVLGIAAVWMVAY